MFRRYKSAGDEPGTKEEIVIKVDPIAQKPATSPKSAGKAKPTPRSGSGAKPALPAKASPASKAAPVAKAGKSATSLKSGKDVPAAKSGAAAKAGKPAASGKAITSGKVAKAGKPAASDKASRVRPSTWVAPAKPEPVKRGLGSRLAGLLARPEPELDVEEDLEQDEEDAEEAARRREDLEAELQRQAEEFGLATSDPVLLYGPNGEEVAALLESLADVDDELAEEIADSFEAMPEAERKVAQSVIRRRHRGGKLGLELDTAERAVADWYSALGLAEDEDIALYGLVADAATNAVDALVLVDDLADEDFNTLYTPWGDVMDADEDDDSDEDEDEGDEDETEDSAEAEESDDDDEDEADAQEEGEFGPNTTLVTELLTKLGSLESDIVVELIEVWREQPKEELRLAHLALQSLADESAKWREQMRLAQEEVFSWMENGATRFNKPRPTTADWSRTREIAGPAVADAVAALVMADMLESEDAAILYGPWAQAIQEPSLPVYEDEAEEEADDEEE